MHLKKLRLANLGPFDEIEFEFDERVNVFTGPNNSGKSTVLMALGAIVVYPFNTPEKLLRTEPAEFEVEIEPNGQVFESSLPIHLRNEQELGDYESIMEPIGYSSFIPAMRRSTDFRAKVPVMDNEQKEYDDLVAMGLQDVRKQVSDMHKRYKDFGKRIKLIRTDASSVSDEEVVQKIVELDYRAYRRGAPAIRGIVDKTVAIASEVTEGYPLRFIRVDEDNNGLFPLFDTPDGSVPFNVLSQGTQSLVQWLARLLIGMAEYYDYQEDIEAKSGILIIDEIDAHLHPSWQRRIIPSITKQFPNLQIFCSTHSPLMLAGLKSGQVQLLQRDEDGKVTVSRNEEDIVGWSADEILRSFLNVSSPTDLATVQNLARLQELRQVDNPTEEESRELEQLRETIHHSLLGGPLSKELDRLRGMLDEAMSAGYVS